MKNATTQHEEMHGFSDVKQVIGLRMANAGLIVAWGFGLTYVLIRKLGADLYADFVLIVALGFFILLADCGLSYVSFVLVQKHCMAEEGTGNRLNLSPVLATLFLVIVVAVALYGAWFVLLSGGKPSDCALRMLFLLFVSLNLPWQWMRQVATAMKQLRFVEVVEFGRRVLNMLGLLMVHLAIPFWLFVLIINVTWVMAFGLLIRRVSTQLRVVPETLSEVGPNLIAFLQAHRRPMSGSLAYSLIDQVMHSFLYMAGPLVLGVGRSIIVLDTLVKLFRGSNLLFRVVSEGFVPGQTTAVRRGEYHDARRATWIVLVVCAIPAVVACGAILLAGPRIFDVLFDGQVGVPFGASIGLVIIIFGNFLQNATAPLLVRCGYFVTAGRIAAGILAVALVAVVLVAWSGGGLAALVLSYAVVYLAGSLAYGAVTFGRVLSGTHGREAGVR